MRESGAEAGVTSAAAAVCAPWFAVSTSPRHEKRVHARLLGRKIEAFLPLWGRWSRWKDRRKRIEEPLFPGYCFARFAAADRVAIIKTVGVRRIIGGPGGPEPVSEQEVEDLKTLVQSGLEYDPYPGLAEGMAVEVARGPLAGARGVLVRKERRCRLVISVNLIRQSAAVEVDAADVVPL